MASVNKCIFIGNLGKDPDTRFLPDGKAVCNFSIACTESWKDKSSGEKKEATEWVRISAFGRLAEVCGEYLKKGSQVYIEGRLKTRKYEKDGADHYITEIMADQMKMLGSRPAGDGGGQRDAGGSQQRSAPAAAAKKPSSSFQDMDDDIPF